MPTFLRCILALTLFSVPLHADVTIVRSVKITSPVKEGWVEARGTLNIKGDSLRRETQIQSDGRIGNELPYIPLTVTLVSLKEGKVRRFDTHQNTFKTYSFSKWKAYLNQRKEDEHRITDSPFQITQSWSRVMPDNATQVIRNQSCKQLVYEWRFRAEDPETYAKKEFVVRTTLWLASIAGPLQTVLQEEAAFKKRYYQKIKQTPLEDLNGLTLQYAERMTGVEKNVLYKAISEGTARLQKITGYPIQTQTEWFALGPKQRKPLFTITSDLETLAWTQLAEAVFNPTVHYNEADQTAELLSRATVRALEADRQF